MVDARSWLVAALAARSVQGAAAQTPTPARIPRPVAMLEGCWRGDGKAIGKQVAVTLTSRSILDNAMLSVDVQSNALKNVNDRYSAHLVFGGLDRAPATADDDVVSFWSDTFGGAYAIMGRGRTLPGGFDVTYDYAQASFVNGWRLDQNHLTWVIVQRARSGSEKPFATYALTRAACS